MRSQQLWVRYWTAGTSWSSPANWVRAKRRSPKDSAKAWVSARGIISPTFVLVRIHPNLADGRRPGGPDLVHVDAYRLDSAAEIDDIDLENTMDSSVTVVEWGRDRVEHLSDSRLEVDLHRAVGGEGPAAPKDGVVLDFDTDDDDEPRTIVFRGFGPRWAEAPQVLETTSHVEGH
jgi:tRNA threonylcarbamoyladenosine biosynthesis protein TsaE